MVGLNEKITLIESQELLKEQVKEHKTTKIYLQDFKEDLKRKWINKVQKILKVMLTLFNFKNILESQSCLQNL